MQGLTMSNTRGYFIVFEGCDGCGKTTQTELLRTAITEATGRPCLYEREPNERNAAGAIIRSGLYGGVKFLPESMAYLHVADRLEHIEHMIPLLESGNNIVCDRYYLSNMAYNVADNLSMEDIYEMNKPCIRKMKPDLFVFLDVPLDVSKKRRSNRGSDRELYDEDDKQAKIRANYFAAIELLTKQGEKVVVVDATQDIEAIANEIRDKVFNQLNLSQE